MYTDFLISYKYFFMKKKYQNLEKKLEKFPIYKWIHVWNAKDAFLILVFLLFLLTRDQIYLPRYVLTQCLLIIFLHCMFFLFWIYFVHSLSLSHHNAHRRRLEDWQRGLVNYLVGNETTIGPEERLYEYLEEPR